MILSFINICKVLREVLKTLGFVLRFQHSQMLMNGIIFDPSIPIENTVIFKEVFKLNEISYTCLGC